MIRGVFFDYGGVLTESGHRGYVTNAIADLYGLDSVASHELKKARDAMYHGDDEDAFFRTLNRVFRKDVTKEMFLERVKRSLVLSEPVYDLARRLRAKGIKTGILSNVFSISAYAVRNHGGYEGFSPIVLSSQEGYAKPEPEIYKIAASRMGLPAAQILFIDDQEQFLLPAEDLGMRTIHAVAPEQVVVDTERMVKSENGISL